MATSARVKAKPRHAASTTTRNRKAANDDSVEVKKKVSTKTKATKSRRNREEASEKEDAAVVFNPLADIDSILDGIEKSDGLSGTSVDSTEVRQHTGCLCLDLILGKGLLPGMYVFYGPEQSCKSTLSTTVAGVSIDSEVPINTLFDYEGSLSPDYLSNILETQGLKGFKNVLGVRDPSGGWVVPPKIRYYSEGVAEKFFDYVAKLERMLPDKVKIGDKWYYVYEDSKANRKKFAGKFDELYAKKRGALRIPAPNASLQALIITDSLPAMLPERLDVDDPGSGMAAQARMFSEQLRRIKGKLRKKRICILAINQLRQRPAAMFQNPEYEPCGEAAKFFSDARLRMYPRALSAAPCKPQGKSGIETEESVIYEGKDSYRYINVRATKNKLSVPGLETWLRLWIKDPTGTAHGFDPVFDTWYYLIQTGQALGNRKQVKLQLDGKPTKRTLSWEEFKILILGEKKARDLIFGSLGLKPFNLRGWCYKQLHAGNGLDLYFETLRVGSKEEKAEKEDGDDEE